MSRRLVATAAFALALASGCASSSSGGASVSSGSSTHRLDEHANGTTVSAHLGDTIVVVLHNTYWTFTGPTKVLQAVGAPEPSPSHCPVMGSGCGTVTATYNAANTGTTTLQARRSSCGEARRCTGSEGTWTVTVRVN